MGSRGLVKFRSIPLLVRAPAVFPVPAGSGGALCCHPCRDPPRVELGRAQPSRELKQGGAWGSLGVTPANVSFCCVSASPDSHSLSLGTSSGVRFGLQSPEGRRSLLHSVSRQWIRPGSPGQTLSLGSQSCWKAFEGLWIAFALSPSRGFGEESWAMEFKGLS